MIYRILKDQLRNAKKQLLIIKKNNASEAKKAMELKKKIEAANAKKDEHSIADHIKEVVMEEGSSAFKFVGSQRHLTPKLKAIIEHLLNTDKRKHNRYCPCCRNYEEGPEPTVDQMGEFLEFIRQQHIKTHGKKENALKRIKPMDEKLEGDSVSEITDLSQEGIMTTSKQLLSVQEQNKLEKYNKQFQKVVDFNVKKHNCFEEVPVEKKKKVNNSRYMIAMELRAKSEPKYFKDEENSAHQFSVRDISLQADSEERAEIAMQTSIIDLKSINQQVDIYDLDQKRDAGTQGPIRTNYLKEKKDVGIVTDMNRKLLVSQDWFYSQLYRDMLRAFYAKMGK